MGEMAERERRLMFLSSKEEQRYGRNKETVVNHSYIESGAYRKKFDRISDDAELNKLLYQLAKKMLLHRSGTLYEDMYWIDPETLQVVASETNCELEQRIIYSEATKRAIKGKVGLLTIHTHPNSFPPSLEDFNSNFENRNGDGIVCCHDGKVFKYSAGERIARETYDFYEKQYYNRFRDEYQAQKNAWMKLKGFNKIKFEEVTNQE